MPPSADVDLGALAKGHQFPPAPLSLSPEWVAEYVAAVEDGAIAQVGGDLVPPMALAALAIRSLLEQSSLPSGTIHVAQELTFLRAVRSGECLSARASVASRGERQGWLLMGIDLSVEDAGRSPVVAGRATLTMPAA
ncbi:MAG: MaoC family dehydratase [Dehalococcoidia bacterium]